MGVITLPGIENYKIIATEEAEEMYAKWKVAGKPLPRWDSVAAVTGSYRYTDDYLFVDPLYARVLRSPYAHAKIKSIDTSKAEALPGVAAVVTYKDIAEFKLHQPRPGYYLFERVFYVGDIVAAVAAEDPAIAAEALDLIEVEYEPLPFALTAEEAKTLSPIHPEVNPNNNVVNPRVRALGDVTAGFAEADVTIETEYRKPNIKHMFTENYTAIAKWEGEELHVWLTTQSGATGTAPTLASVFGIPPSYINVYAPRTGGGFGGKTGSGPPRLATIAALLSRKAGGRPVKLRTCIRETFVEGHTLDPAITTYKYKVGAKSDGTITAMELNVDCAVGRDSGQIGIEYVGDTLFNTFRAKDRNKSYNGYGYYTNIPYTGALRAYGSQAGAHPLSGTMSELAEKLGLTPLEFCDKNGFKAGDVFTEYTYMDYLLTNGSAPELLQTIAEESGWKEKWKGWGQPTSVDGSKRRGIGLTIATHPCGWTCGARYGGAGERKASIVRVYLDGSVDVVTGLGEMGSGHETALIQLVAEVLGVDYKKVRKVPAYSRGQTVSSTGCSESTAGTTYAAYQAAVDVRKSLLEAASKVLEVPPEELELDLPNARIYVKADPTKTITLGRLTFLAGTTARARVGVGTMPSFLEGPEVIRDPVTGLPLGNRGIYAAAVEVEVDVETGKVNILKITVGAEGGMIINPAIVWGQTIGGLVHGWSQMLGEGIIYDEPTGVPLCQGLIDYPFIVGADVRVENVASVIVSNPNHADLRPFRAKGLAEGIYAAVWGATQEAIYNAIGVRIREFPYKPERILKALGKAPFPTTKGVA